MFIVENLGYKNNNNNDNDFEGIPKFQKIERELSVGNLSRNVLAWDDNDLTNSRFCPRRLYVF